MRDPTPIIADDPEKLPPFGLIEYCWAAERALGMRVGCSWCQRYAWFDRAWLARRTQATPEMSKRAHSFSCALCKRPANYMVWISSKQTFPMTAHRIGDPLFGAHILGLNVECEPCGKKSYYTTAQAIVRFGADAPVYGLLDNIKCKACGGTSRASWHFKPRVVRSYP